jgi:hypothetical protein
MTSSINSTTVNAMQGDPDVKRHAHVYKEIEACLSAFKNFAAAGRYQRSDSGMWCASHEDTHNFIAAANLEKLRGVDWDSIEIAEDVTALERAFILWSCMDEGIESMELVISAEPTTAQTRKSIALKR